MVKASGLAGRRIALGVTGGIAAYKAAELTSRLVRAGAIVDIMLTEGAMRFVQPLTFEALTGRPVFTGVFDGWGDGNAGHVSIAREADVVLIAPATANTIARLAHGRADDMPGAVALSTTAPIVIAPAMEHHMWHHAATQHNVSILEGRGATIIPPESGRLASGASGDGRLADLEVILAGVRSILGRDGPLRDRRIVVSAGGTREALDPVRYIGNRSSGRMGIAIAEAAIDAGARVSIVATPSVHGPLPGKETVHVESALEMQQAVERAVQGADALIMAAAVSDFRAQTHAAQKIKKKPDHDLLTIQLVKNPDIVGTIRREGLIKIGFAAETRDLLQHAQRKLADKGLDMIVANDAVNTIGSGQSQATFLFPNRDPVVLPVLSKEAVASSIINELVTIFLERESRA